MSIFDYPTGSIVAFSGLYIPRGWIACDGSACNATGNPQLENLWNVIGTTYGGSSKEEFNLPDLRSRIPVGVKATTTGSGLDGPVGTYTGSPTVTLTSAQSGLAVHSHTVNDPGHTHTVTASGTHSHSHKTRTLDAGDKFGGTATGSSYGTSSTNDVSTTSEILGGVTLNSTTISGLTVSNASSDALLGHENMMPFVVMTYIIKL